MKHKKANVTIYITFIIAALVIVLFAAVLAPMGVLFNTKMYAQGESIMLWGNESVADIQDSEVRSHVNSVIGTALDAQSNNIDINASLFQYSWVIVIGLTAIILFLFSRRLVELGGGGII